MKLVTKKFGEIEYSEENIITFKEGLPGFEEEKEFVLIFSNDEMLPFHQLQSVKTEDLSFVITDPFIFYKDYDFDLNDEIVEKMKIESLEDVSIYSMMIIPENVKLTSINLSAPLVINKRLKKGRQVILSDDRYQEKFYIFSDEIGE